MAASVIGYVWNAIAGRFIAPNGQFVAVSAVRGALDQALRAAGQDAVSIANAFTSGAIGVAEFENRLRTLIKDSHIYSAAVAAGGFDNLEAQQLALLQGKLVSQFNYLSDWADDLARGVVGSTAQIGARARMYAFSARNTFDESYRAGQIRRGFSQERNINLPGENCDQCLSMTDDGWVDIGTLVPVGLRTCLSNCRCRVEYK